jgi:hypothetical protein
MRFTAKWDTAGSNATPARAAAPVEKKPPRFFGRGGWRLFLGVCAGGAERETPQTLTI